MTNCKQANLTRAPKGGICLIVNGDARYYAGGQFLPANGIVCEMTTEKKKTAKIRIKSHRDDKARNYVAKIVGADAQYRFKREFQELREEVQFLACDVDDGFYEICEHSRRSKDRYFVEIVGGREFTADRSEVEEAFPAISGHAHLTTCACCGTVTETVTYNELGCPGCLG